MSKQPLGGDGKEKRASAKFWTEERDKESIDNPQKERERQGGRREEGLMCVYHSLSVFNETVVWFWRQLKLTEALMF